MVFIWFIEISYLYLSKSINNQLNYTTMSRTQQLKNKGAYGHEVKKMDNDTYALRRRVMNVLYDIKNKGIKIPRIEVRIVSDNPSGVCGYAYLNSNVVHIVEKWAKINEDELTHLVLHEVVHAVTGFAHDDECYLMHPKFVRTPDLNKSWEAFKGYIK
jgi:hypothetical protein